MGRGFIKGIIRKAIGTDLIERRVEEIQYAHIFHDTIKGGWFDNESNAYSLGRAAVGYNYYYVVYRILNEVEPKSILEIGLGQSTILIGAFMDNMRKGRHVVIEHSKEWIDFFLKKHNLSDRTSIELVKEGKRRAKYKNGYIPLMYDKDSLRRIISGEKFDFISIDGPNGEYGRNVYNRMDVLDYIPDCLADDFVIIVDDYERVGERHMVIELEGKLAAAGIDYKTMVFRGQSNIYVIASQSWKYLCTV